MTMFAPSFLSQLEQRIILSDLIGQHVKLTRKGREFGGLCPFHKEKTPSFTVNNDKGFYHCFGCGAHGNAIQFVQKTENLNFVEAVRQLAGIAGIEVAQASREDIRKEEKKDRLLDICATVGAWFQSRLRAKEGKEARDYLNRRGIDKDSIDRFHIGFAPFGAEGLRRDMHAKGINDDELMAIGILARSENHDRIYARFRNRIIFPITDRNNRMRGFGGRILGQEGAKYINSPQTALFEKSHLLYGWPQALESARRDRKIIVVEGYLDVISLHQAGVAIAVAPMGTSLTPEHLGMLWRCADVPICCFDGDDAGLRAAGRAAESALRHLKTGHSMDFVFLPKDEDPDGFIRKHGKHAWDGLLDKSMSMADFIWQQALDTRQPKTPEDWAALQAHLYQRASLIQIPTLKSEYLAFFRNRRYLARLHGDKAKRKHTYRRPFDPMSELVKLLPNPWQYGRKMSKNRLCSGAEKPGRSPDDVYARDALFECLEEPSLIHEFAEDLNRIPWPDADSTRLCMDMLELVPDADRIAQDPDRARKELHLKLVERGHLDRLAIITEEGHARIDSYRPDDTDCPKERLKKRINLLDERNASDMTHQEFKRKLPDHKTLRRLQEERLSARRALGLLDDE